MRRCAVALSVGLVLFLLASCGQTSMTAPPVNSTSAVTLSITDEPPSGVTVLFFQINLTAASLTPASGTAGTVSLLNKEG